MMNHTTEATVLFVLCMFASGVFAGLAWGFYAGAFVFFALGFVAEAMVLSLTVLREIQGENR